MMTMFVMQNLMKYSFCDKIRQWSSMKDGHDKKIRTNRNCHSVSKILKKMLPRCTFFDDIFENQNLCRYISLS